MKNIAITLLLFTLMYSCTGEYSSKKGESDTQENETKNEMTQEREKMNENELKYGENKEVVPQEDSISVRKYRLDPRPDVPLSNQYGDDSISSDGDYVYPSRDTIWIEAEE